MYGGISLTTCQRDARKGLYSQAAASFIKWLAGRYDEVRASLEDEVATLRADAAQSGAHRRTPANLAQLGVGLKCFLAFARELDILSDSEALALWARCWTALQVLAATQAQHQDASEPTRRFRALLQAALGSGGAHVAAKDGQEPDQPEAWGWRRAIVGSGDYQREEWRPHGERVGWLDGEDLYLEPEAAYAAVQRFARTAGDGVAVGLATLKKRLHEQGLLTSTDQRGGRVRYEVRKTLQGRRRDVLHVRAYDFLSEMWPKWPIGPLTKMERPNASRARRSHSKRARCGASRCVRIWNTSATLPLRQIPQRVVHVGHLGHNRMQTQMGGTTRMLLACTRSTLAPQQRMTIMMTSWMCDAMNPREIVEQLAAKGITVSLVGENIRLRPGSRVPSDLVAALRLSKPAVIAYLQHGDTSPAAVADGARADVRASEEAVASPYARTLTRQLLAWAGQDVARWRRLHTALLGVYAPAWDHLDERDVLVAWAAARLGILQAYRELARIESAGRATASRQHVIAAGRRADISFWDRVARCFEPSIPAALTTDSVAAKVIRQIIQR